MIYEKLARKVRQLSDICEDIQELKQEGHHLSWSAINEIDECIISIQCKIEKLEYALTQVEQEEEFP